MEPNSPSLWRQEIHWLCTAHWEKIQIQEIDRKVFVQKKKEKNTSVQLTLKNGFELFLFVYQMYIMVGILMSIFFLICSQLRKICLSLYRGLSFAPSLSPHPVGKALDRFPHSSPLQLFCNMNIALLLAMTACPNSSSLSNTARMCRAMMRMLFKVFTDI